MAILANCTCHRFLKFELILGQLGIIISHIFRHSKLDPLPRRNWGTVSQIPDRESFLAGSNGSNFQWDETVSKTGSGGINLVCYTAVFSVVTQRSLVGRSIA